MVGASVLCTIRIESWRAWRVHGFGFGSEKGHCRIERRETSCGFMSSKYRCEGRRSARAGRGSFGSLATPPTVSISIGFWTRDLHGRQTQEEFHARQRESGSELCKATHGGRSVELCCQKRTRFDKEVASASRKSGVLGCATSDADHRTTKHVASDSVSAYIFLDISPSGERHGWRICATFYRKRSGQVSASRSATSNRYSFVRSNPPSPVPWRQGLWSGLLWCWMESV